MSAALRKGGNKSRETDCEKGVRGGGPCIAA
jgi:hypothetical protein